MKKLLVISIILLLGSGVVFAQSDSSETKTYVSLNGNFFIEYPASWFQVPYVVFDAYLESKDAGRPIFDYEVVLASTETVPFYLGSYFILSIEKVGKLSDKQIDSVLADLSRNFGTGIKYFPVSNFLSDMKSNAPNYDKNTKTVSIYSKIVQHETEIKNSLIMMKFYDFGIATFYCYGIGESFERDKEVFSNIVASLNSDDLQSKLPKEKLKVADIDTTKKGLSESENSSSRFVIYISLGIVLILLLSRRRKKKK